MENLHAGFFFKLLCWIACLFIALAVMATGVHAADNAKDLSKKNLIYMAYDDSGSMYRDLSNMDGFHPLARWSQAKYALEVFSSMMLEKDEIFIYPLQEYGIKDGTVDEQDSDRIIHLLGTDSPQERLNRIEGHEFWYGQNTAYHSVKYAYEDLAQKTDPDTERWLVILTDGAFDLDIDENGGTIGGTEGFKISRDELDNRFSSYADNGVHVVFLRIFDGEGGEEETPTHKPDEGIYVYEARKSADTLERLNEISNLIFKRQVLSEQTGQLSRGSDGIDVSLDAPAGQLVVFAQGKNISVGDLTGDEIGTIPPSDSITIGSPQIPVGGTDGILKGSSNWKPENLIRDEDLGCTLTTFDLSTNPAIGDLHIGVTDTSNLSVYVRPAVKPVAQVVQDGSVLQSGEGLKEGAAEIVIHLVNNVTGEELDASSALLSNIKYDGILVNGEPWSSDSDRQEITLTAGSDLTVSGSITIEQSSYEMETFTSSVYETIGDLALTGEVNGSKDQRYSDLAGGTNPAVISFTIQENGVDIPTDRSKAATIDAASDNTSLTVTPVFDEESGCWNLCISCTDAEALLNEQKEIKVRLEATALVETEVDQKTASGSWDVTLSDPSYVGDIQISDVKQVLDGDALYQTIRSGEASDVLCLTFTISEDEERMVTPQDGDVSCELTGTQEGNGVSFSVPAFNEETGVYEAFLTAGTDCLDLLQYEDRNASIPWQLTASVDRGNGPTEAVPVSGSFSFENPLHIPEENFGLVLEPTDGISLIYQNLIKDPDGSQSFTVRLKDGEEEFPPELKDQITLKSTAENEDAFTMEISEGEDGNWIVKPKLKEGYLPDFSGGTLTFPITVEAELSQGEGKEAYKESASGTIYLSAAESGVAVTIKDPEPYEMRTMALSEDDALNQDSCMEAVVTKDEQPLTVEEWENFELTKEIQFVTNKDKKLKETAAEKTAHLHLAYQILPEESKILIYPWAEANDLIKIGSLTLHPGFSWRYTDYGIPGEEHPVHGTIRIKGLPWYLLLLELLEKYWMFLVPVLILFYILTRYLPKDYLLIIGRYYGFRIKKNSKAIKNVNDRLNHIQISNEPVTLKYKIDWATVLCFWKNIKWMISFTTADGRDVEVEVNKKNGAFRLTPDSRDNLAVYKVDGRHLVVWGAGGAAGKDDLADMPRETVLREVQRMNLRFRFADTHQIKKSTDLKIRI